MQIINKIENMGLLEQLKNFERNLTEQELKEKFEKLAETFLYGGYINVNNRYHIYIRTVEFYYHDEKVGGIKDPIVYHRDNYRDVAGEVLYYPPMMLHAHNSGYDITFEDEQNKIRSSALIRAYEVYDVVNKCLWCWNTKDCHFVPRKPEEVTKKKTAYNTQCTYLKAFLNGFIMNGESVVNWVSNNDQSTTKNKIISKSRQGVYKSKDNDRYIKTNERCDRLWAFMRDEDLIYR